jgi:N-acetylmuramoyl-L-alanine amidase
LNKDELKALLLDTFGHLDDNQIMGLTIYGEARGESTKGKIAVGSVILERVDKKSWMGKTIQEVCLCPNQFSCFLPSDPNFEALNLIADNWVKKYVQSVELQQCHAVARGLMEGLIPRTEEIARHHVTQYKTPEAKPKWAEKMRKVAVIDNHEFYA